MKKENLFELLGDIDEAEVQKAGEIGKDVIRKKKKRHFVGVYGGVAAACLALAVGGIWFWQKVASDEQGQVTSVENKGQGTNATAESEGIAGFAYDSVAEHTDETGEANGNSVQRLGEWSKEDEGWLSKVTVVNAHMPEPIAKSMSAEEFMTSNQRNSSVTKEFIAYRQEASQLADSMDGFYNEIAKKLLANTEENAVCSPLNIYLALSLLAETTDGSSRQQILDFLGVENIESLRNNVNVLWNSNYVDTPINKSILANSLWLNENVEFNMETLERLAEEYHASSFIGDTGSKEMTQGLRSWTNRATGGLLQKYVQDMQLSPDTILDIVSTLYFHAWWYDDFQESATKKETFHGSKGDTIVDMMHQDLGMVYRSDQVTAVRMLLKTTGSMYFCLPKEGVDVSQLVAAPEILGMEQNLRKLNEELEESFSAIEHLDEAEIAEALENYYEMATAKQEEIGWSTPIVHASIPKFKVDQKSFLTELLVAEGITDVLNPETSDFSPLTNDISKINIGKIEHAATLEIDEKGVTGAAYVEELLMGAGPERAREIIDFVLDRPFIFVVYSGDGSVLFEGIVRNIE